ncbi:uncharacterized protein [Aphelocoma coerulescens]|uniref:uncharacterized protein n=1 Tax=Aphelocoma coerulescens TaxID=39617 RepID=UPI003604AFB4
MGPLQPGLPSPSMLHRDWMLAIIDIKDCFFNILLHPQDAPRFAFSIPSLNEQTPLRRHHWLVLPQGMKNSPTICQCGDLDSPRALTPEAQDTITKVQEALSSCQAHHIEPSLPLQFAVLGACLAAAIDHRLKQCTEEKAIIDSLQSLVEILQKQLDEEKNKNHLLEAALKEEYFRNSKNADSPKETEEKETPHIDQIYPQKELILVKNCGENCCPRVRPLIKTEYNYINDEDFEPHITTKQIPYTAVELARLKKEYGRLPHESETEYVFRVSLTRGDQIQLTEQEASGYWGHGVFLTTGDKRGTWSLTQRTAFWTGGLNPLERGDPLAIIGTPDQLLESVHKAACLQMIHERKLTPGYESPMQLPVKPALMTPLIRGLPESLKPTAIALQKTIAAVGPVERLDRFLGNPSDQTGSTDPGFTPYSTPSQPPGSQSNSPARDRKVWTWSEVAKDLINYSRKYGPIKIPEEKLDKTKGVRIWAVSQTNHSLKVCAVSQNNLSLKTRETRPSVSCQ